jgi:hypothetical protein
LRASGGEGGSSAYRKREQNTACQIRCHAAEVATKNSKIVVPKPRNLEIVNFAAKQAGRADDLVIP